MEGRERVGERYVRGEKGPMAQDIDTLKEEIAVLRKENEILKKQVEILASQAGIQFQTVEREPVYAVLPPYRGFK